MKLFKPLKFYLVLCTILLTGLIQAQTQIGIDIYGEAAGDRSGYSVSMPDANTVAIGAIYNDGNGSDAGHVRIYSWNGIAWVQQGGDIDGEAAGDRSGHSVSMPDANTVAIGASFNDGNGSDAGHVRIYSWNGIAWVQQGGDIDGEAADDYSGHSVSMPDANTVAIGTPFNDGNGSDAGHVRVYSICTPGICDDGDPCTIDTCDPVLGCQYTPAPDSDFDGICDAEDNCPATYGEIGDSCDDGIACTENDVIDASCECHGTPNDALCDDNNVCNGIETCDINLGCQAGTPLICDDGNPCTGDTCDPILGCQFTPLNCDDGDPCTIDTCDPVLFCIHTPAPDSDFDGICDAEDNCPTTYGEIGDSCDDGIACTENDVIDASCECHGTPNDALCDDNNVCNGIETCDINFGCLAGTPLICDDGNPFTSDFCDPILGCQFVNNCGPANNDCASAQSLPIATFPATSNVNGTLFGASNSGGVACAASAAGGDVFYSFTIAQQNHVAVSVNPFAGADVVVEVLDGCAGTTIACINNVGSGGAENQLLQNLSVGTYYIRVHNASGSPEPEVSSFFLINVQQLPFANVQNNSSNFLYACNQNGFQLEDFIGATPQTGGNPWIMDYKWLVAEESGGYSGVYQRTAPNYGARISWLGMTSGKTYNVFVSMLINHPAFGPVWTVYDGDFNNPHDSGASPCTVSTSAAVAQTELLTSYASTLGELYDLCDVVVAQNVQNPEDFRWRFDPNVANPGDELIYTRGSGNPGVRLSWVPGIQPGTIYTVDVQVRVNGNWSAYGVQKPLALSAVPQDVAIRSQYCGGTYGPNSIILSESVCEADYYRFRLIPVLGGSPVYRTSGNYALFFNGPLANLAPGDYNLSVKVSQGGQPGDYGPDCLITIGGPIAPVQGGTVAQREIAETGEATLYPNPITGKEVRVTLTGLSVGAHDVVIAVYDIYGKQIASERIGHEGTSLSRLIRFNENLAKGMYMVQVVVDGERVVTERLVVQ